MAAAIRRILYPLEVLKTFWSTTSKEVRLNVAAVHRDDQKVELKGKTLAACRNLHVWIFANHWSWPGSDTCHYRAPQKGPEEHDLCFRWPFLAWGCSSCAYETSLSSENQHFGVYPWASQHNDGKWPHLLVRWCTYEEFVIFHGYVKLPEGLIMGF